MTKIILAVLMCLLVGCMPRPVTPVASFEWTVSPIAVYVDDTIPEVQQEGVASAIEEWNAALGHEVFINIEISGSSGHFVFAPYGAVTVSSGELGTRLIDTDPYEHPLTEFQLRTILGEADLKWDTVTGRALHCMVLLDYEVNSESSHQVAVHELGHCLGLNHSWDDESIMFVSAVDNPGQHILQSDIDQILTIVP